MTESSLLLTRKSFYDNKFLVYKPSYSATGGKLLLLYTQMFMRENRTMIQILRKKEFHYNHQSYLCFLERESLGLHLTPLVFLALLVKHQC